MGSVWNTFSGFAQATWNRWASFAQRTASTARTVASAAGRLLSAGIAKLGQANLNYHYTSYTPKSSLSKAMSSQKTSSSLSGLGKLSTLGSPFSLLGDKRGIALAIDVSDSIVKTGSQWYTESDLVRGLTGSGLVSSSQEVINYIDLKSPTSTRLLNQGLKYSGLSSKAAGRLGPIAIGAESIKTTIDISYTITDPYLSMPEKLTLSGAEILQSAATLGAGAGGSAVGFGIGHSIGGPPGAIVGSIVGGAALGGFTSYKLDEQIDRLRNYYYTR